MSIFDTLVESGVTQEDLEKAASARLFAEAAAAEGIDLSELTEDQAEELYDFWANGGEEAEKAASAEDLLAEAAVKEAGAKLAEAEYIGRYMARVYADELNKIAGDDEGGPRTPVAHDLKKGTLRGAAIGGGLGAGAAGMGAHLSGRGTKAALLAALAGGTAGGLVGAVPGAAVGGLHGLGREQGHADKKASAFDLLVEERALDMLKEAAEEAAAADAAKETAEAIGDRMKRYGRNVHNAMGTAGHHLSMGKLDAAGGGAKGLGYAATGAALGGLGYGVKKLRDAHKKESSIDALIEARALEMLEEAASEKVAERTFGQAAKELLTAKHVRRNVADVAGEGAGKMDKAKAYLGILRGKAGNSAMTSEARKSLAAQAGLAGAVGAAGYGAKKMYDRSHKKESSAFDELALVRAQEMLEEAEISEALDAAALELLAANGYDV